MTGAPDDYLAVNRANWDERATLHSRDATGFYQIEAFRAGVSSLHAIEASEVGDVAGKRLIHLQCHIGLDTLSLARLGADATGLDFSPAAIRSARALALETGLAANFVEGNVYDARSLLSGQFDIAYVTWGAINWLPDITRWAGTVASLLAPGGFLYLAEGHPFALVLDERDGHIAPLFNWRTPPSDPIVEDGVVTYTGDPTPLANRRTFEWMHPLSDIVNALVASGLTLSFLNEHELLPWKLFASMQPVGNKLYRLPDGLPRFPLAFSLKAVRQAEQRIALPVSPSLR